MQEYFLHFQMCFCSLSKAELFLHFKNAEMFPTFWKCRNISSIFQMSFCSFQKLELFLHLQSVDMFPTFWKCRNISCIFQMCFCSCQKLNCSYILKMQKCFLHFGNAGIFPAFSNVFLQFSKVRTVPTFKKCRNVSYILEMQEYFQHFFKMCFCSFQKLELFLHLKSVDMFPTFWKCRNISCIFQMSFCSCQRLNCSYILKMQKCFLHFGNAGIFPAFLNVFLQFSKAELFLHLKNVEMFPTF